MLEEPRRTDLNGEIFQCMHVPSFEESIAYAEKTNVTATDSESESVLTVAFVELRSPAPSKVSTDK